MPSERRELNSQPCQDKGTQRKKSQTYLTCEGRGSGMHRGDKLKVGPTERSPTSQGKFMQLKSFPGPWKLDALFKETPSTHQE